MLSHSPKQSSEYRTYFSRNYVNFKWRTFEVSVCCEKILFPQTMIRNTSFGRLAAELSLDHITASPASDAEVVLIEVNHFFSHHCALPLILNGLRQEKQYRFVPYIPLQSWDSDNPTLQFVLQFYEIMGIDAPPIKAELTSNYFDIAKNSALEQFDCFKGPVWNLSNFVFDGIPLGIHLVETLLQQYKAAEFNQTLETVKYSIGLVARYLWWKQFFSENPISYVFGSHVCYEFALPLLVAKKLGRQAYSWHYNFLMDANKLLPLPQGNPALLEYSRRSWEIATDKQKQRFLNECELELQLRAQGTLSPRLRNDPRFLVSARTSDFFLESPSSRLTIAIWSHAFSDAPNVLPVNEYGALCNPLVSLGKILETLSTLDCDVYVKTHPNPFPQDELALQRLLSFFPAVVRLPNELSPSSLKGLGFDCVITGWGTVCFEASYIGLPVLTYTDFLGLEGFGITKTFDIADPKSIQESIKLVKKRILDENVKKTILEQYVIYTCGVTYDLTCSDIPHLPREGEKGLYSLHSFLVWEHTFDRAKFQKALGNFKSLIKEHKVALSPFCDCT